MGLYKRGKVYWGSCIHPVTRRRVRFSTKKQRKAEAELVWADIVKNLRQGDGTGHRPPNSSVVCHCFRIRSRLNNIPATNIPVTNIPATFFPIRPIAGILIAGKCLEYWSSISNHSCSLFYYKAQLEFKLASAVDS